MTNKEFIETWLNYYGVKNYTIRPTGVVCSATNSEGLVVDVDGGVDLADMTETTIPVQFGNVSGYFSCSNTKITSLEHAPQSVGGGFYCSNTKITSLHGIHKIIKHIGGVLVCNPHVTHVLGLLLIKGITNVNIDRGGPVYNIINKYIGTDNVIMAQDELIDAGFIEQAKL